MSSIVAFAAQTAPRARVRDIHVPDVGVQAPQFVLKARRGVQECLTDFAHKDPCAVVSIEGQRYTVAWDAKTGLITYILTTDLHFLTDSELTKRRRHVQIVGPVEGDAVHGLDNHA